MERHTTSFPGPTGGPEPTRFRLRRLLLLMSPILRNELLRTHRTQRLARLAQSQIRLLQIHRALDKQLLPGQALGPRKLKFTSMLLMVICLPVAAPGLSRPRLAYGCRTARHFIYKMFPVAC